MLPIGVENIEFLELLEYYWVSGSNICRSGSTNAEEELQRYEFQFWVAAGSESSMYVRFLIRWNYFYLTRSSNYS